MHIPVKKHCIKIKISSGLQKQQLEFSSILKYIFFFINIKIVQHMDNIKLRAQWMGYSQCPLLRFLQLQNCSDWCFCQNLPTNFFQHVELTVPKILLWKRAVEVMSNNCLGQTLSIFCIKFALFKVDSTEKIAQMFPRISHFRGNTGYSSYIYNVINSNFYLLQPFFLFTKKLGSGYRSVHNLQTHWLTLL